jgi:hypothetical protein
MKSFLWILAIGFAADLFAKGDLAGFVAAVGERRTIGRGTNAMTMEVLADTSHAGESFSEDWLIFMVKDSSGHVIAKKPFNSSYAEFRIDGVDLDGDGICEFVFLTSDGRGTSARRESLSIVRLSGRAFETVVSCPRSDFYAAGKRWWYAFGFRDTDGNGTTDIELTLCADDAQGFREGPKEHVKVFKWIRDQKGGKRFTSLSANKERGSR